MSSFDISETLMPNSEQLDAIELVSGPRIFTVERVSKGSAEQPVNVHFVDFPRPWRPSKGMRRILAYCWGADASKWAGHRCELFFDPEVTFGKDKPGGTRIARLSHIGETKKVPLLVSRGKSATFTVDPLPADPTPAELAAQIATSLDDATTEAEIREWGNRAHARGLLDLSPTGSTGTLRELVQARLAQLEQRPDVATEPTAEDASDDPKAGE